MTDSGAKMKIGDIDLGLYEHRIRRSSFEVKHWTWSDHRGGLNTGIELSVVTPWGKAVAHFPNCGKCDWREWLADIGHDYIGSKLFGLNTRVPDYSKTLSTIRGSINELRAEDAIDVNEANWLRSTLRDLSGHLAAEGDVPDVSALVDFVRRHSDLKAFGDPTRYRENPKFRAFLRHAWMPFTDHLQAELDRERAMAPIEEDAELMVEREAEDPDMEMAP